MTDPRHDPLAGPDGTGWAEEASAERPQGEPDPAVAGPRPGGPRSDGGEGHYRVRLPVFEGPLDLLLHLIRVNEINIYDIPIAEVTRQYEVHLGLMRELDLEVAGEYLVMAATLVYIKSKTILPAPPDAEEPQEDPRAELRDRLLEYQRLKEAARDLAARDEAARRVWGVGAPPPEEGAGEAPLEVSLFDLLAAFQRVLASIGEEARLELRRDTLRVADGMSRILEYLDLAPALLLDELLLGQATRAERVVTFLALLELVRLQALRATQARSDGPILLWRRAPLLLAAAHPARRAKRGVLTA